ATDVGVNKATRALFKVAATPEKMLDLGEERLRDHIRTTGLYRNKAKNVIALSQMLVDQFCGKVPETRDELVRLPGVGRKTANVVLSMAFGQAT
ncbi:endonuclease III, partial [Rhizobium johnstonii]|uniref:endonuclease III domain-containing protein n=1 Tax=Rhizobium johnstonii TaxID=3019933 RepID=UPI003F96A7BA